MYELNLDSVASKAGLLPEDQCVWTGAEIPLPQRGVSLNWLINFVHEIDQAWQGLLAQHDRDELASIRYDGPWPEPLPFSKAVEVTPLFVVNNAIRPLTQSIALPLLARVPEGFRGKPEIFISHAWTNRLAGAGAFCTLYALDSPFRGGGPNFIWIDIACYNQHRPESIAADMREVIASIGRLGIPMIDSAPFSRLWCLWELLCAHVCQAEVNIYEANGSAYDMGFLAARFEEEFQSVEGAKTTFSEDRDQILQAMVATFGSVASANQHVREVLRRNLTHDSDKPWNRTRS